MANFSKRGAGWSRQPRMGLLALCVVLLSALLICGSRAAPAMAQEPRNTPFLDDVAFVSSSTFFAAGNGIYKSINGGRSWVRQFAIAGAVLRAVDFADARHGCAVGSKGLIVSTNNGGRTWVRRVSPTRRDLTDVDLVDRLHGWAVGSPAVALVTANGGRTWKRQLNTPAAAYREAEVVRLFSRSVGLIGGFCHSGSSWTLSRTVDGGLHWPSLSVAAVGGFSDIDLAGNSACAVGYVPYEIGSYPPVCFSSDRGKTWQVRSFPWPAALWSVDLIGPSTVYAVGADDSSADVWLYRSTDAGITWDRVLAPSTMPAAMHFNDFSDGSWVTSRGSTYVTADGGQTWRSR